MNELTKKDFEIQGTSESGFWLYIPKLSKKFEVIKFRDDSLQALKLMKLVEKAFESARQVYNQEDTAPDHKEHAMQIATTFQSVLDEAKK